MILEGVKIVGGDELVDIRIEGAMIAEVSATPINNPDHQKLTFDDSIVFPGLINSHDHLDFNLFPQLGDRLYHNYTEWGAHIHQNYKPEINAVLNIPASLRSRWGIFKNLLCGVTTVVNHGERTNAGDDLITVFEDTHCLHSVKFEKNWKLKLNNPFKANQLVNIHVGEGIDKAAHTEIDELLNWNLFQKKLIGVHAVAMTENQAKKFEALVWCPQSNYFLLDKTAPINLLKAHTKILFGTDSTLTSNWDIWEHLRLARQTKLLSDEELYLSLNQKPASTWQLNSGEITAGKDADLVVAKVREGVDSYDLFFNLSPANLLLVIHRGQVRLFDESLLETLGDIVANDFSKIYVDDTCKYVQGNLPGLMDEIRSYHPGITFPVSVKSPVLYE